MVQTKVRDFLNDPSIIGRDIEFSNEEGTFRGPIEDVFFDRPDCVMIICAWTNFREHGMDTWIPGSDVENLWTRAEVYPMNARVVRVGATGCLVFVAEGVRTDGGLVSILYPAGDHLRKVEALSS